MMRLFLCLMLASSVAVAQTLSTPYQHRRGTAAALTSNNITPLAGEIVCETDTEKCKLGDGSTAWNSLAYMNLTPTTGVTNPMTADLDVGGYSFISLSDGDITIAPDGVGKTIINSQIGINTETQPDTALDVNGAITERELSADPADPDEGSKVCWMSDGTGSGDDGDYLCKITAGGSTKTATLIDFSAI